MRSTPASTPAFSGWRVVAGAFVLAVFGWGLGFYGPPVYLHAVREARGWPIELVSAAVTAHYLFGAALIANLPRLYKRFGLRVVTRTGALALAAGLFGWANATAPWQLLAACMLSGCGWVTMGAAAINAIIAPWFVKDRPKALSMAYNGASVGGIIFSPLWVFLISQFGFPVAAAVVGLLVVVAVWLLTASVMVRQPVDFGQQPDGASGVVLPRAVATGSAAPPPAGQLWRDWRFRTLAVGMALGLFGQIGLLAHLFSLIAPKLGVSMAGVVAGLATASAIVGRTTFGWLMPVDGDRRIAAALSYGVQIGGAGVLLAAGTTSPTLIVIGVLLFGFGIGNATSLPPLIAQVEFTKEDAARVVPLIVAVAQATYAFAPAAFGLLRAFATDGALGQWSEAGVVMCATIVIKVGAIGALMSGRWLRSRGAS